MVAPKSTKAVKSRRRLPVDDFEEKPRVNAPAADDSFLAVVETKTAITATSKAKKTLAAASEPPIEVVKVQSAPRGRPKRVAATIAASKVTEGLEEEAARIDRKRREAEPIRKTTKSRRKVLEMDGGRVLENSVEDDGVATEPRRPPPKKQNDGVAIYAKRSLPKKQAAGRKRKAAPLDVDEKDELAVSVAQRGKGDIASDRIDTPEQSLSSKSAPKSKTTKGSRIERNPKQNGKHSTVQTQLSMDDSLLLDQQPLEEYDIPLTAPQRTKIPSKRRPLAEADMNIIIRSSSPEKVPQEGPKLPIKPAPKSSRPCEGLTSPEKITRPTNKRQKLDVQRDAGEDRNQSPVTILQPDSQADPVVPDAKDLKQSLLDRAPRSVNVAGSANQSRSAATVAKRGSKLNKPENVEQIGAKKGTSKQSSTAQTQDDQADRASRSQLRGNDVEIISLPNAKTSTSARVDHYNKPSEGTEEAPASRPGDAEDEDVDWLVAPQPHATTALKSSAKSKRVNASSRWKMPEIDLDDLLSNIATFAHAKTASGPGVAQNGLFHSHEQGEGGRRKRAKV